jgi:hypothetical protein
VKDGAEGGFTLAVEEENELLAALQEVERGNFVALDDLLTAPMLRNRTFNIF